MNQLFIHAKYKDGDTEQEFAAIAISFFWNKSARHLKFTDILGNEDELSDVKHLDVSLVNQLSTPGAFCNYNAP